MKQPEYRREDRRWRKYREIESAAKTLRTCPERAEGTVEGRCAAAVKNFIIYTSQIIIQPPICVNLY